MNATDLHHQALSAIRSGADDVALAHFSQALSIQPDHSAIQLDCARFLACLFRFNEAIAHARAAISSRPNEASVARAAATIATTCRSPELAIQWLSKHPTHPGCLFDIAVLLERIGRLDEAAQYLAQAEKIAGSTVDGRLLAARIEARSNHPEKALTELNHLLSRAPSRPPVLAKIHYARGHALDQLGEYDQAFAAWSTAKQQLSPIAGELLATSLHSTTVMTELARHLTPEQLASWKSQTPPLDGPTPILLTGYVRSGTTLLEHLLLRQTNLVSADENTAFRDLVHRHSNLDESNANNLWQGLNQANYINFKPYLKIYQQALLELTKQSGESPIIIEKNPQLLPALPIMLRHMPHMPVWVIHRDPRDVMVSCFSQDFGLNHHSIHFLTMAHTARHLAFVRSLARQFESTLGNQLCVTRYETLITQTHQEITRVAQHFNIATVPADSHQAATISYSPTYAEVTKPVHTTAHGRWQNYKRHLDPHLEIIYPYLA